MRQFASSRFRLWNLSRPAKLIYTCFCGLSLLAILSSLLLYEDLVGPSLRSGHVQRVATYYGPDQSPLPPPTHATPEAAPDAAPPSPGPAIAIADEDASPSLTLSMPYRKLLEVTHFHLFTIPVFVLILTHLYLLTETAAHSQLIWISLAWLSALLHILSPWLIRYGSPHLSLSYPLSGGGLLLSCLWLTAYPVWVMWRGKPHPPAPPPRRGRQEVAPPFSD
jgi:hypothetical protein